MRCVVRLWRRGSPWPGSRCGCARASWPVPAHRRHRCRHRDGPSATSVSRCRALLVARRNRPAQSRSPPRVEGGQARCRRSVADAASRRDGHPALRTEVNGSTSNCADDVPARIGERHALAGEEHLQFAAELLAGLQARHRPRTAGDHDVPGLLDRAVGPTCSSRRSPSARFSRVVTCRGLSPVLVSTTSATTYSPTNDLAGSVDRRRSLSASSATRPLASTGTGRPRGEAAVAPAEVFPAGSHLRVGRVDQGGPVVLGEGEAGVARVGVGEGGETDHVAGLVHDLGADRPGRARRAWGGTG